MTENNRLQTILEKQDAADRAHVAELARQAMIDSEAKASRARVRHQWRHLWDVLAQTMATANDAMTGGRKLYSQPYNPNAEQTVADVIIMLEDKYSEDVERKCVVGVDPEGTVLVSMSGSMMPKAKEYSLSIWTASVAQIEGIVYDFLELNIGTR